LVTYAIIVIFFEQFNNPLRENFQNHQQRKGLFYLVDKFQIVKNPFKKANVQQKQFMQNSSLLIIKNHLPMQFVEIL